MIRSTTALPVRGSVHSFSTFDLPCFDAWSMTTTDAANARHQIHRPAHALHKLAGDHPAGQIAVFGDFHRAKDRHGDLATADHGERGRVVEIGRMRQFGDRLLAGIDKVGVLFAFERKRPHAE